MEDQKDNDPTLSKLLTACCDLRNLLQTSANVETTLEEVNKKLSSIQDSLTISSKRIGPLQTLSIANKALDTRINRAISPALALLDSFKLSDALQTRLLELDTKLSNETVPKKRLKKLIKYVDCVDNLNEAISLISQECEPAIQKLQEVVEFLSRTKAADQYRTERLRETMITLKALYETEVDVMKFDGVFDEALMNLQDEFEGLLQQLRHQMIHEADDQEENDRHDDQVLLPTELGSDLEVEALGRIAKTLAANDCLDICIDIYVKVKIQYFLLFENYRYPNINTDQALEI